MIPESRLDALTDGVFAFAMTLLVLALDLPPSSRPKDDADLIAAPCLAAASPSVSP